MHDIDRTQLELSDEYEADEFEFESDEFESDAESDQFLGAIFGEVEGESDGEMDEVEEMELASQLLEVSDEAELDQFIGKLLGPIAKRAAGRWSQYASAGRPPTPQPKTYGEEMKKNLGKGLKKAAVSFLPTLGQAVGGFVGGGPGGGDWGKHAGTAAKGLLESLWGLELEGLSPEDQEFEIARRYVRFANATVRNATRKIGTAPPQMVARTAFTQAARRHAPGLIRVIETNGIAPTRPRSGRWVRRGNTIVVHI